MLYEENHRLGKGFSSSFYTRLASGASAFMAGMLGFTFWAAVHLARRYYDSNGVKSSPVPRVRARFLDANLGGGGSG